MKIMLILTSVFAAGLISLPVAAINFTSEAPGIKADGYMVRNIFFNTAETGSMEVSNYGAQSNGNALAYLVMIMVMH